MSGAGTAVGRRLIVWLAAFFTLGGVAFGASGSPADTQYGISGSIGPYPIAMVITVRDRSQPVAAHYSYASREESIPLTLRASGSSLLLTEPSGATFDLRLIGPPHLAQTPLTFYTSTGLVGSWSDGSRRLPVKLTFQVVSQQVRDCELYPDPPAPRGVHFPQPGCEHTPDKAALDACINAPFTSDKAVRTCIDDAGRTCLDDQMDQNFCAGNIDSYLDQTIEQRLLVKGSPMTAAAYRRWQLAVDASCKRNSVFSPDGSGYGADISLCTAAERLRLLQNGLRPMRRPIG